MPATTVHERWPYPLLSDPADPADLRALAQAMDASLTRVDSDRRAALRRPTVSLVRATGSVTATVGTSVALTWTAVEVDTAGTTNIPAVTDRIVVPAYPCVMRIDATLTCNTSVVAYEIGVERALNTVVLSRKLPSAVSRARLAGLVRCAASDVLRLRLTAIGASGGTASVTATSRFTATLVCRNA